MEKWVRLIAVCLLMFGPFLSVNAEEVFEVNQAEETDLSGEEEQYSEGEYDFSDWYELNENQPEEEFAEQEKDEIFHEAQ